MKTRKSENGNQPLTLAQFQAAMGKIDKKFEQVDRRFNKLEAEMDQGLKIVNAKLASFVAIVTVNTDRAIRESEDRQDKRFNNIFSAIDAFIKRTEANEREILFLGRQHDDLAHYCTEKIGYPTYGRG